MIPSVILSGPSREPSLPERFRQICQCIVEHFVLLLDLIHILLTILSPPPDVCRSHTTSAPSEHDNRHRLQYSHLLRRAQIIGTRSEHHASLRLPVQQLHSFMVCRWIWLCHRECVLLRSVVVPA